MKIIEITEAISTLAEYVQEIDKEPVIVVKNGLQLLVGPEA